MEKLLDSAWEQLYLLIQKGTATLDLLLSYLHFLGPVAVIFLLAAATITLTRILKKYCRTKRLASLEENFQHWLLVRQEAMCCEDREKGKALAKNIDKAELNKAYYDYFFEGLMLGFITFYLPVISMASYVNEAYRAERLTELFGQSYIFSYGSQEPVLIGALFLFISAVVLINSSIFIINFITKRYWTSGIDKQPKNARPPEFSGKRVLEQSSANQCA